MTPATLHHRIEGSGRQLLILHPVGLDLTFFDPVAAILNRNHRILRVDLRGHGQSADLPRADSLADYVDDVHHLLQERDFAPTAVVGVSFGGMVAQMLAVEHPGDVDALVVCACPCTVPPEGRVAMEERAAAAKTGGMAAVLDATLERWFTDAFRASGGAEATRARLLSDNVAGWAAAWQAIATLDVGPRLHEVRAPTLCVAGELDRAAPPDVLAAIAERIPGARMAVMAGAPHMLMIEQPEAFAALVDDFLKGAGAAPSRG